MKIAKIDLIAIFAPLCLFVICYLIIVLTPFPPSELITAITLDFVITVPLVYFLFIRKSKIPNYTVVSFFVASIFIASFIVPQEHNSLISYIVRYLVPLLELGVLGVLLLKFIQISKGLRRNENQQLDFYDKLKLVCEQSLPKSVATFLASEIAVVYYTFRLGPKKLLKDNEFSYHKKSGSVMIMGILSFIILIETFAMHIMIDHWSSTVAWGLFILSMYTLLQVFALARSFAHRPNYIDGDARTVCLRYGFFTDTVFQIEDIERIEQTARSLPAKAKMVKFSPLGSLDNHNLVLYLKKPCNIKNVYGKDKVAKTVAVYIDNKKDFLKYFKDIPII